MPPASFRQTRTRRELNSVEVKLCGITISQEKVGARRDRES